MRTHTAMCDSAVALYYQLYVTVQLSLLILYHCQPDLRIMGGK